MPHSDAESVRMPALYGNGKEHSVTDSLLISDTVRFRGKHVEGICNKIVRNEFAAQIDVKRLPAKINLS